jgi:hypothetical protein
MYFLDGGGHKSCVDMEKFVEKLVFVSNFCGNKFKWARRDLEEPFSRSAPKTLGKN